LLVGDYKSGDGVMVGAEENKQGMFYAAAALEDFPREKIAAIEKVVIAIVQPSDRKPEIKDVWETTVPDLMAFKADVFNAVDKAEEDDLEPVAGSHCQFCPAQPTCPVKTGLVQQAQRLPVADIKLEQIGEVLAVAGELESWLKAVKAFAHEQATLGVPIKGFKLVDKQARRTWNDPAEITRKVRKMRRILNSEAFEEKLKSPAQLEKVCKEKGIKFTEFAPYISMVSSGTTLVPESDKRQPALPSLGLKALAARL